MINKQTIIFGFLGYKKPVFHPLNAETPVFKGVSAFFYFLGGTITLQSLFFIPL